MSFVKAFKKAFRDEMLKAFARGLEDTFRENAQDYVNARGSWDKEDWLNVASYFIRSLPKDK